MQVIQQKRDDVLTTIVALLVPHKGGCSLQQLCRDYLEMAGEEIPWRELGYASLMNFLQSMPTLIQVEFRYNMIYLKGIASNKSKHISQLVSGQKDQKIPVGRKYFKPSPYFPRTAPSKVHIPADILTVIIGIVNEHPDGVNKDFVLQKVQDRMPHTNITMSEMEDQLHRLSHKMYLSNNKIFPISGKFLRRPHSTSQNSSSITAAGEENFIDSFGDENEDDFEFMSPRRMPTNECPTKSSTKVKSTSNFIKDSLSATKSQCNSNTTNNKVKEVSAQSEINKSSLLNSYNNNNDASINNNNYNEEKENYVENNYAEDLINSRVKFRLEKLIQNNPDGIWCAELPDKYLEEYKLPLNYTELGFSSVREFASQLPSIFQCVQFSNTGDSKLYDSKRPIPSSSSKEKQDTVNLAKLHAVYLNEDESEALPMTLTIGTCNQLIPEGVVTIGESVGQISVTDLVSEEKPYIEVIVVEVFTPTFFWIQLRKKQKAFKTFMDDIHNFYVTKHSDFAIPPVILEKGLNCACIYNNIWHRGIIKTVKPDMQVTVMFYDYGTLKTYPPNEIYYLHRMFSILPAQAIPCGLYNVRPYQASKWSRSATHKFAVRTSSIPFVATVEPQWINETDNSMLITLTDTIEEEDVHINDWLVEQKLAEHGRMVCMKKRNFPFQYYLECQNRKQKTTTPISRRSLETVDSIRTVGKQSPKLQFLYEKLIACKRNSQRNDKTSKEFNAHNVASQSSNYDSALNEKPLCSDHDNDEHEDDSNSSQEEKMICELSSKQDNILRNFSNMPSLYAHDFQIQDSEDELNDIVNPGDDKNGEFEQVNWSIVRGQMIQEKNTQENVTEKIYKSISKKRDTMLAENYFLRAVQNSIHFAERDEEIGWLPSGNVNKVEDPSPLVLRNIQKRSISSATETTIGIPMKILKSIYDTPFSESVQESSSITGNDSSQPNDRDNETNMSSERVQVDSDSDSTSHIENQFTYMKLRSIKHNLIKILLRKQNESNHSSVLDSDDLSEETKSNNNDELNTDNGVHSTETETMNLTTSKSFIGRTVDKNKCCEEPEPLVSSTSLESFRCLNKSDSYEESEFVDKSGLLETSGLTEELVSVQSADMQENNLTEHPIDEKEITLQTEELLENELEKMSTELVPINKSSSLDVTTAMPSIPVFNDVDIDSGESSSEEWDVHIRHSDIRHFLKIDFPLNKNIDRTLESDTRLKIEEINDLGSSNNTDGVEENCNRNVMRNNSVDSTKYSNTTFANSNNEHSTSASVICSENNAESSSNESSASNKLKSMTLMLNKLKLKRRNIAEG